MGKRESTGEEEFQQPTLLRGKKKGGKQKKGGGKSWRETWGIKKCLPGVKKLED